MNRRTLLALLPAALTTRVFGRAAKLPESHEILRSFDARDWAKAFVAHVEQKPAIATDPETMTGWFANALMRGWDEHTEALRRDAAALVTPFDLEREEIRGAVARGWCAPPNAHKAMDCDLAEAIAQEVLKLRV
jgi:hypothetical protein